MAVFKKKPIAHEEVEQPKKEEVKEKAEDTCDVEGCYEKKAPGQTYVCQKHIRAG